MILCTCYEILYDFYYKKLEKFDELSIVMSNFIATDKSIISHYYNANCED